MESVSPALRWEVGKARSSPVSRRWVGVKRSGAVVGVATSTASVRASLAPKKGEPFKRKVACAWGGNSFGKAK